VNPNQLIDIAMEKTQAKRLTWTATQDPYELTTSFSSSSGKLFYLRMVGVPVPTLTLETRDGQAVMKAQGIEHLVGKDGVLNLKELWKMIEIGGRSAEDVAEDALDALCDL